MYIEPIYLRAEQGELPELKRVIVAYDKEVVMTETLSKSLETIFGMEVKQPEVKVTEKTPETKNISELINSIVEAYSQTEAARRKDNWVEYGKSKQKFEQLLQQLKKQTESN